MLSIEVITPERKAMEQGGANGSRFLEVVSFGEPPEPLEVGPHNLITVSTAVVAKTSIPEATFHANSVLVYSYESGKGGLMSGEMLPVGRWLIEGDLKFYST